MELYKHYKNGKLYEIIDYCLIQEEDKWCEAIIYRRYNFAPKFCRSLEEFMNKFELVKE